MGKRILAIATANRFNPIRQATIIEGIIQKATVTTRPILAAKIMQTHQRMLANRANTLLITSGDLQLTVTTNTEPRSNMKTLNILLNRSMILTSIFAPPFAALSARVTAILYSDACSESRVDVLFAVRLKARGDPLKYLRGLSLSLFNLSPKEFPRELFGRDP